MLFPFSFTLYFKFKANENGNRFMLSHLRISPACSLPVGRLKILNLDVCIAATLIVELMRQDCTNKEL